MFVSRKNETEMVLLRECYECCKTLIDAADSDGSLIGVGRQFGQVQGPNDKRMRKAVSSLGQLHSE